MRFRHSLAAGLLLPATASFAFNLQQGARWEGAETVFHVDIPGVSPSGVLWNTAFEDAMAEWSERTAFNYLIVSERRDPCAGYRRSGAGMSFPDGNGDGRNGVAFGDTMCDNELGRGVAAVTLTLSNSGPDFPRIVQTDIIFNSALEWDVYSGLRRPADFRRTALHELGHALGLGHEEHATSIMTPNLSAVDFLQADDILGANTLYGSAADCEIRDIAPGTVIDDSLTGGDCTMFQLFGSGNDTSFVDAYRLTLTRETRLSILMESKVMDSVLILTDGDLTQDEPFVFDDDSAGGCNARLTRTLPAGEYHILANTFNVAHKCGGNTGPYRLTVSEKSLLTTAHSVSGLPAGALFAGGASRDGGQSYAERFAPTDAVTVTADILVPEEHVGRRADLYVMAVLEDGRRFGKNAGGQFERIREAGLDGLPVRRANLTLDEKETVVAVNGLRFGEVDVRGVVKIFVGYALAGTREIMHSREPIRFVIE